MIEAEKKRVAEELLRQVSLCGLSKSECQMTPRTGKQKNEIKSVVRQSYSVTMIQQRWPMNFPGPNTCLDAINPQVCCGYD